MSTYEIDATAEYGRPVHHTEKKTYAVPDKLLGQALTGLLSGWYSPEYEEPVVSIKITPRED